MLKAVPVEKTSACGMLSLPECSVKFDTELNNVIARRGKGEPCDYSKFLFGLVLQKHNNPVVAPFTGAWAGMIFLKWNR